MNTFVATLQFLAILMLAPLMLGLIRKGKATFQNRIGASVFLPYWSLLSLLKKEMTITRYSSWVFHVVPFFVLGSSLVLALLVPTFVVGIWPSVANNIFMIASVLAIGSIFLVFGGMDTASTFGNMGSSREMTIASLIEPVIYLVFASLGLIAGSWYLDGILMHFALYGGVAIAGVTLLALLLVVLAENARYPVDNPATHLELTMVHEAMILEYSGPYLAMLEYASMIKLTVLVMLLANLVAPVGLITAPYALSAVAVAIAVALIKFGIGAFLIAAIESTVVKMRFYRMQEYIALAFFLSLAGLIIAFIATRF